jgi:NADH:ubiquinone oxidoreductase subunit H
MKMGLFAEYANMFISTILAVLFFGGYNYQEMGSRELGRKLGQQ